MCFYKWILFCKHVLHYMLLSLPCFYDPSMLLCITTKSLAFNCCITHNTPCYVITTVDLCTVAVMNNQIVQLPPPWIKLQWIPCTCPSMDLHENFHGSKNTWVEFQSQQVKDTLYLLWRMTVLVYSPTSSAWEFLYLYLSTLGFVKLSYFASLIGRK